MHTTTVVVYDSNPASILLRACDAALPLRGGLPCGELPRPNIGGPSGTRPPPPPPHKMPLPSLQQTQMQQQTLPQTPRPPPLPDVDAAAEHTLDWPHDQHTTKCSHARSSRLTSPRRRVDWPGV